ncbi:uncharacterized protein [Epargyreus clarus]|uniref:uncharacterized protein n=1 Tax=Epargyreus clarus TaxID=520877 RepID=UPI003C2AF7CA
MEDEVRHRSRDSNRRRLDTPVHTERVATSRSRSRLRGRDRSESRRRMNSSTRSHRDRDVEQGRERVKMLERELLQERQRLLVAEGHQCSPQRPHSEYQHRSSSHHSARRSVSRRADQQRGGSSRYHETPTCPQPERQGRSATRVDAGASIRSRSPSISRKTLVDILNSLKDGLPSRTHTQTALSLPKIDNMNILPNFDPSTKNQRVDVWLKKVNECALVYGWDDRTTTHFAMQKLQGLARIWYEGLNSVLFSWSEWREKLINAFPCEQNYGQALEEMLRRRSKINEPIEVYFYEKLALLSQCDIVGKRAVDCIIHGINDRNLKSGALALRCLHPDQLLQFLISSKDCNQFVDRNSFRNKNDNNFNDSRHRQTSTVGSGQTSTIKSGQTIGCYNCRERGHSFLHCPKPLLKCTHCNKVGHTIDKCFSKTENKITEANNNISKTLCIDSVDVSMKHNQSSKFVKDVRVNGKPLEAFIDFGSDITLIRESSMAVSFCQDKNIKHILNAVASPRSNGQVERYNRTILDSLKTLTIKSGEKSWDSNLGQIQWGLNNTTQRTTGRSPSEVLFGTSMNSEKSPILSEITEETHQDCDISTMRSEVKNRIDSEQDKQKLAYDKNRKPARIYREGDLVKITKTSFNNDGQSKKLLPSFVGPYRVIRALGNDRYDVAPVPGLGGSANKRPTTVAADRMMPWIHIAALELNDHSSDNSTADDDDGDNHC